jgi:hypothetical protein
MKNLITPLFIIAFVLISCKNETENQPPKAVVPFYQVANQQQNQTLKTAQPDQGQSLYPASSTQTTTTQTQTVTAPVAVAKGMNPSHGQPGHRCDIPVGAPLNTAVATNKSSANQVINQSNMTVTPSSTAVTTAPTPKGMNPPHGQPGHRCDIPVGSPLNSPVAATKPAPPTAASNYTVTVPTTNETTVLTPAPTPAPQ